MNNTSAALKSIHVVAFSNHRDDWYEFCNKFMAVAEDRGYEMILDGTEVAPPDDVDIEDVDDEEQRADMQRLRKANKQAYRDLILATTSTSLMLVTEAKTQQHPGGDARLAWQNLKRKWEPTELEDKADLMNDFLENKLQDPQSDPVDWITDLQRMRRDLRRVNYEITDESLIMHIMLSLPAEYDDVVRHEKIDEVRPTYH